MLVKPKILVLAAEYAGGNHRGQRFQLDFLRRDENVRAGFDQRRKVSGLIFNWKFENVSPLGARKKIME